MLWTAAPQMLASIASLEKFSEGLTPGYFILRIALVLLAVLVLIEAIAAVRASLRGRKKTMNLPFPTAGLWMLLALALLIDANVLSAISGRTLGLLEHDLLQALPLYVFVGVLLQRLTVADSLFSLAVSAYWRGHVGSRVWARWTAPPPSP